ncbi:ferric reductase-like transmembrane domain-containing protein [uncultured Ruegeria sp.]|uniref:ferric reductase-like transmembrane domain-containing protein n=1 Tax=uncultured Ruegeria sp. TaxID=259304 RepID=UPI002604A228|nr:ferric reductase-like transmembrane domain-containing protein [uncultured Ruegeria sp.]
MSRTRRTLIWGALAIVAVVPIAAAAYSPFLAWRSPVYIVAGFAGIIGMVLLLVQPLLAGGYLPGLSAYHSHYIHRWVGAALVTAIIGHVAGLWVTSPPDMVDALLFVSPTPFSAWGVIAMWALFAAAFLALLRRRLHLRFRTWRLGHTTLTSVTVLGSVVHAMLIEGTMENMTKTALCVLVLSASIKTLADLRVWVIRTRRFD